jgi:flavin-dependent dehydrogenase
MKTIVGCGLSGLATAVALSLKGEEVEILDRSSVFGSKFPESVHAFRNYSSSVDERDFIKMRGFSINFLKPIHKIVKIGPSSSPAETYSKDKPLFYATKRGDVKASLDRQLFEQADGLQVNFRLGEAAIPKEVDVIATGATFATEMGYGHHYKGVSVDGDTIIFFLNDDYAPKGYAYAIPYGKDEVSVVTTSFDPSTFNKMPALFKHLIEKVPVFSGLIDGAEKGPAFAKIGFSYIPDSAKLKEMLIVGEAAGFSEADRGFGMHYALESGFLAAKALTEKADYDALWKGAFEGELVKAFKRRLMLNRIGNAQYDQLINAGTNMSADEYVRYKETQNTSLIKQVLINLHTANEIRKLRKKFNIKQLNGRLWVPGAADSINPS